ncbi:MAG: hypothetical protein WBY28_04275 [Nitrososphaeraceae archaeon]
MNIVESEIACQMIAKTCGCKDNNRKVTYSIIDSYHNLCSDKRDIILAQIEACEKLSKYTKDGSDHILLEHEIVELKLALDLLH